MIIVPLPVSRVPELLDFMRTGAPYVTVRTESDYWAYATLFASTCPVALVDNRIVGAMLAFRSQEDPADIYIQDCAVHPDYRGSGVASQLLVKVCQWGREQGCRRVYATAEPDNSIVHSGSVRYGFTNVRGDRTENGVEVIANFKGPGKDRAVYELNLE